METRDSEHIPLMLSFSPTHCQDSADDQLAYKDFWPACLHAEEGFSNVHFELFGYVDHTRIISDLNYEHDQTILFITTFTLSRCFTRTIDDDVLVG